MQIYKKIVSFGPAARWRERPDSNVIFPRLEIIRQEICQKHNVTMEQLTGLNRRRRIVAARFEAMWRMSVETGASLNQIASKLGKRHHTTILHGINRYQKKIDDGAKHL